MSTVKFQKCLSDEKGRFRWTLLLRNKNVVEWTFDDDDLGFSAPQLRGYMAPSEWTFILDL